MTTQTFACLASVRDIVIAEIFGDGTRAHFDCLDPAQQLAAILAVDKHFNLSQPDDGIIMDEKSFKQLYANGMRIIGPFWVVNSARIFAKGFGVTKRLAEENAILAAAKAVSGDEWLEVRFGEPNARRRRFPGYLRGRVARVRIMDTPNDDYALASVRADGSLIPNPDLRAKSVAEAAELDPTTSTTAG